MMNDDLQRVWKEPVKANPGTCLEGLRKTTKIVVRIACAQAEI
jgi:hypothetical protein